MPEEVQEVLDEVWEEIDNADYESVRSMMECADSIESALSELRSLMDDDEYVENKEAIQHEIDQLNHEKTYALTCADEARNRNRQWDYDHPLGMPRYRYF